MNNDNDNNSVQLNSLFRSANSAAAVASFCIKPLNCEFSCILTLKSSFYLRPFPGKTV
jgi:hypothetical protein